MGALRPTVLVVRIVLVGGAVSGPVYDMTAERAVLAHAFLVPAALRPLTGELGLRPDHFFNPGHREIYHAMIDLHDAGDGIDQVALDRRVSDDAKHALVDIVALYYHADAYRDHAKRIIDCHRYERTRHAAVLLEDAAGRMDDQLIADAELQLTEPSGGEGSTLTGMQRKERALERLDADELPRFPLPWARVNDMIGGGAWPGRYMLVGGYTGHGKSCLVDGVLEHAAGAGRRVAVYLTETTEEERLERSIARNGPLTYSQVQQFFATPKRFREASDVKKVADAINGLPEVACVEAHDWTAGEIARHIRHHQWDMAAVDGMHDIQHRDERDLAEIGRALLMTAKQTRTALFVVVHLNDNRVIDAPPIPVNRDIRGSGMLVRQADVALMVWQEEGEDGPTGDGLLRVTKCRQGRTGTVSVQFSGERQRWGAGGNGLRAAA